jgi:hypothetical protein
MASNPSSLKGAYRVADQVKDRLGLLDPRVPPRKMFPDDKDTNESIHPSALVQDVPEYLKATLHDKPKCCSDLLPLEEHMREIINNRTLTEPFKEEGDFVDTVGQSVQQILAKAEQPFSDPNSLLGRLARKFHPK